MCTLRIEMYLSYTCQILILTRKSHLLKHTYMTMTHTNSSLLILTVFVRVESHLLFVFYFFFFFLFFLIIITLSLLKDSLAQSRHIQQKLFNLTCADEERIRCFFFYLNIVPFFFIFVLYFVSNFDWISNFHIMKYKKYGFVYKSIHKFKCFEIKHMFLFS